MAHDNTYDAVDPIRDARNDDHPTEERFEAVSATLTREDWNNAAVVTAEAEGISSEEFLKRMRVPGDATEAEERIVHSLAFLAAERRWLLEQGATEADMPRRLCQRSHDELVATTREILAEQVREAEAEAEADAAALRAQAAYEAEVARRRAQGRLVLDLREEITDDDRRFATMIMAQALGVPVEEFTAQAPRPYEAYWLEQVALRRVIREVCAAQHVPVSGLAAVEDANLVLEIRHRLAHPEQRHFSAYTLSLHIAPGADTD